MRSLLARGQLSLSALLANSQNAVGNSVWHSREKVDGEDLVRCS
jgi:hypothetical protein